MYQEAVSKVEKVITFAVLGSGPTWFHVIESRNGIVHFWYHSEVCCVRIYWLVRVFYFSKKSTERLRMLMAQDGSKS